MANATYIATYAVDPIIKQVMKAELIKNFFGQLIVRIFAYFDTDPNCFYHHCVFCKGDIKDSKYMRLTLAIEDPTFVVNYRTTTLMSHQFCYELNKIGLRQDCWVNLRDEMCKQ